MKRVIDQYYLTRSLWGDDERERHRIHSTVTTSEKLWWRLWPTDLGRAEYGYGTIVEAEQWCAIRNKLDRRSGRETWVPKPALPEEIEDSDLDGDEINEWSFVLEDALMNVDYSAVERA